VPPKRNQHPARTPRWLDTLILWVEVIGLIGALLTGGYALFTLLGG
jgi:hypothetical protein